MLHDTTPFFWRKPVVSRAVRSCGITSCEITSHKAQSYTPNDHCVRFAVVVTFHAAALVTKRALLLSRIGLSPAGPRQLCLAHRYTFTGRDLHSLLLTGLPAHALSRKQPLREISLGDTGRKPLICRLSMQLSWRQNPKRDNAALSSRTVQKAAGHRDPGTTKLYDRRGYNPEKAASFFATY